MRHNARITLTSVEADGPRQLNLYLASFATPNEIKVISRKALRGMRRHLDSERFYINLIRLSRAQVNIFPLAADYLWEYEFHLSEQVPKIVIANSSNGLSKTVGLFRWLGPEREISEKETPEQRIEHYVKKPGRRSELSKDARLRAQIMPAPDYIDPVTHLPVFNNNRARRKA